MIFHSYVTVYQKVNHLFQWAIAMGRVERIRWVNSARRCPEHLRYGTAAPNEAHEGSRHFGGAWEVLIFLGGWEYIYIYRYYQIFK